MGRIHILSDHEARKIAAGEVVERPASVVKELLENALDAGASEIAIHLQDGGKQSIVIIDNGCGMSPEDIHMSVEHHATSKIKTVDELTSLTTFGFRGEALSSIASVSTLRIISRQSGAAQAYMMLLQTGDYKESGAIGAPYGTQMSVERLFDNVPARQRFLKQRDTEWRAIHQLVMAYALAFPHIGFTLTHEGHLSFSLAPHSSLYERGTHLFDHELATHLIHAEFCSPRVSLHCLMTDHQYTRYDRKSIFCFVNNRWVKNHILGKSFLAGYQNILPAGKYPAGVLLISVPGGEVDINIHPRKEEVLLQHPYHVSRAIEEMVARTLIGHAHKPITVVSQLSAPCSLPLPDTMLAPELWQLPVAKKMNSAHLDYRVHSISESSTELPMTSHDLQEPFEKPFVHTEDVSYRPSEQRSTESRQESSALFAEPDTAYTLIGQLRLTYLLIETGEGLLILDQHAAHESALYAQLQHHTEPVPSTKLIFPEAIDCSPELYAYIVSLRAELEAVGYRFTAESSYKLLFTSTPAGLRATSCSDLVAHLAESMEEGAMIDHLSLLHKVRHTLYALIACKRAVKGGDTLNSAEMKSLVDLFLSTRTRITCPHGRPTSWSVSYSALEKMFQRIN